MHKFHITDGQNMRDQITRDRRSKRGVVKIITIIIIFNIFVAQINIQEDTIKCVLHIKTEYKITMLPIYNFDFTIKCKDVYYMKH